MRNGNTPLADIIASAADAIVAVDEEQRIIVFNGAAEKMFGHRAAEVIGKPLELLIPERFRAQHKEHVRRFGASGETSRRLGERGDIIGLRANGGEFPLEATISQSGASPNKVFTAILRDLTARMRVEIAQRAGELRLESVIASVAEGIISVDENFRIVLFNPEAERMFGHSQEDMSGQPLGALLPQRFRERHEQHLRGFAASGQSGRAMGRYGLIFGLRSSGEEFPLEATISQTGAGHNRLFTVILRDITERVAAERQRLEAEEKLRASNQQLALLVEFSPLAIYARDRDGLLTSWNPAAEQMFGWKAAEVLGKLLPSVPDGERAQSDARRLRILAAEPFIRNEARRRRKDGSVIDIDTNLGPLRDASGGITGVIAVVADITARKQAEEERAKLAAIVENANVGIFSRTLDGTILTWNAGAVKMLGYTAAEAIGKTTHFTLPPGQIHNLASNNEAVFRGEVVVARETDRITKDGRVIDVLTSHSPIRDGAGNIVGASVILQDITGRKVQEQRITRLSRINAVLSGINAVIVRVRDHQELFNEACRIAVEHGHFGIAWIGRFDPATQDVTPVAWAGEDAEEVTSIKRSARDDTVRGKGAVGRAIRERRPVFTSDLTTHGFGPRLKEVLRLGFQSHIVLPLFEEQTLVGTLAMYAREPDFFDEEELKLLSELAGNISFALEHITRQQKLEKLSRIRTVLSAINALIVRARERRQLLEQTCRIAVEHGGFGIAWIGMLDQQTLDIISAAWAGIDAESMMKSSRSSADPDNPLGQRIVGRSVRERRPVFSNDLAAETSPGGPRRLEAIRRGYRSVISLPLMVDGIVVAGLSLFTSESNFFDDEELLLLTELAANVSFALELMQKGEALADSEKKLDNILSTLHEVVWSMDPHNGRIVYVNAAVEHLTRRPVSDFLAQPRLWRRMVHRDDRASVRSRIRRLLLKGTLVHEFRIVLADGDVRTVESSAHVRHDDTGNAVRIDGTISDITERVRAVELQLRHYELARLLAALASAANESVTVEQAFQSSLRLISDHGGWRLGHMAIFTPGIVMMHSATTSLWHVDDCARFAAFIETSERFDYTKGKRLVGRAIAEKIPVWVEDLAAFEAGRRFGVAAAAGLRCAFAFPVVVQSEVAAVLEFYAEDVRPADRLLIDNIMNIAAQLARVIERARANEGQTRLAAIVESSQDAIVSSTADGTILTWNAGAEKMFGYASEEVIGRKLLSLIVPNDLRQDIQQRRQGYLSGGRLEPYESERLTKDQRRLAVSVTASPLKDESSQIIGIATIYRDITERKQAQESMRAQAMQLRQLSRRLFEVEESERRRLARELHDRIGQNVTALSLNLNMVRGELSGEYPQNLGEYLDECDALLHSTGQLIRNVMADLRPPGLDELGLLAALNEHARRLSGLSGFSITVRGAEAAPRLPPATEITLFRIAQEALINVAKHARASAAAIALEADPDRVILTISDNGSGFNPAARFSEGILHLGMVSMRERAESIGGRLRVESAPGRGTRVIAEAPCVPGTPRPRPPLSATTPV